MTATEVLPQDHQIILLILAAARREARTIRYTGQVNA